MPTENSVAADNGKAAPVCDKTTNVILKMLLTLAVLYTLYVAKTLILPVVIASFLALFCNPLVLALHRRWVPRVVSAIAVMITITSLLIGAIALLAQPAEKWIAAIPYAAAELADQFGDVRNPFDNGASDGEEAVNPADKQHDSNIVEEIRGRFFSTIVNFALNSTPILLAQILAVVILVYFFLVYGEGLLRKLVHIRPGMAEKRLAVVIVRTIQTDVSHYVLTVALINTGLGIATGLALWALGVRDPALWGALVTLLNFAPYLGPLAMVIMLTFVGFIQFGISGYALLIPMTFLALNFVECQLVTPTALGHRLHLNPLLVFVWLISWGWMWGAAGMLIGVPLLVCCKIIASHLHSFDPWIQLLER